MQLLISCQCPWRKVYTILVAEVMKESGFYNPAKHSFRVCILFTAHPFFRLSWHCPRRKVYTILVAEVMKESVSYALLFNKMPNAK